jgi:hypothetical protein
MGRHMIAEQRARRHLAGAPQRPQREGQRRQQAIGQRLDQHAGIEAGHRIGHRQNARQGRAHEPRCQRAKHQTEHHGQQRQQQHLGQIGAEDEGAARADALERGNRLAAGIEIGVDGIGHPDTADDQRGQPDQRQEHGETGDLVAQSRRGVKARTHLPARLDGTRLDIAKDGGDRGVRRPAAAAQSGSASAPGCRAAPDRSPPSASSDIITRGPQPTPPPDRRSGSRSMNPASTNAAPDLHAVADRHPRDARRRPVRRECRCAPSPAIKPRHVAAALDLQAPVERIDTVDGLHLGQRLGLAARRAGHGPQRRDLADPAERFQECPLVGTACAVDQR